MLETNMVDQPVTFFITYCTYKSSHGFEFQLPRYFQTQVLHNGGKQQHPIERRVWNSILEPTYEYTRAPDMELNTIAKIKYYVKY